MMRSFLVIAWVILGLSNGYVHNQNSEIIHRGVVRLRHRLSAKRNGELDPFLSNRAAAPATASGTIRKAPATSAGSSKETPTNVVHSGIPLVTTAIGVGTVTSSPTLYVTKTGLSVCNVRLACKQALADDFPGVATAGDNDLIHVAAEFWGRDAEHIAANVDVGSRIAVSGSMYMSKWIDKVTGKERSAMKLRCRAFELIAQPSMKRRSSSTMGATTAAIGGDSVDDHKQQGSKRDGDMNKLDYSGRHVA